MSVEDKLANIELNHLYAYLVDMGESDRWANEVFTENAFFDERQFGLGVYVGRKEIAAYGVVNAAFANLVHHMTNHLVTLLSDTTATGVAFCICEVQEVAGGPRLRFNVVYQDEYTKVNGSWLMSKRVLVKTFETELVTEATALAAQT